MKKLVSRTSVIKRGTARVGPVIQIPLWPSCVARNAMLLPSGDQRGLDAFQPAGNKGRPPKRSPSRLRRGSGDRLVGGPESGRSPTRTSQRLLFVSLPSFVESE